jgi:DNA-binding NarL/FixJ family response regulator
MIRVAICDDHEMVREALANVVELAEDMEVVGVSCSWDTTQRVIEELHPDVLVVDVRLDGESGLDVARRTLADFPLVRIVVLTSFASDEVLVDAHSLGASAFMLKTGSADDLINVVRDVASGLSLIDPDEVRIAAELLQRRGLGELRVLDENDRQIARLIALGYSDKQIADTVFLGLQTVRNRVSRMLGRLQMENRTQLALFFSEFHSEIQND